MVARKKLGPPRRSLGPRNCLFTFVKGFDVGTVLCPVRSMVISTKPLERRAPRRDTHSLCLGREPVKKQPQTRGVRMSSLLASLLKFGGITALTVGVLPLLYRQASVIRTFLQSLVPRKPSFSVVLVAVLVWLTAMTALLKSDQGAFALVFGNENRVIQSALRILGNERP